MNLIGCNRNNLQDQLIGRWQASSDQDTYIEFTESGFYNIYIDGKNLSEISNIDSLKFRINQDDLKTELIILEKSNNLFERSIIQLENEELVSVSYKQGKGIDHHIDEYWVSYKNGKRNNRDSSNDKIRFIYPENYIGASLIIYDESEGVDPEYDLNGNKVYSFSNSGILKISSNTGLDPFKIAKGEVGFYYQDEKGNLEQIKVVDSFSSVESGQIGATIFGYNQIARHMINDIIGDDSNSNMLFLSIGSNENLNRADLYYNFVKTFKSVN